MGVIKGSSVLITMLSLAVVGQAGYHSYTVEELENNMNHVEDEKKKLEQEQADNLAENNSLSEELEKLEKDYHANEEKIQEYEQRIEQLQSDIKAREEKLNSLNNAVEEEDSQEPVAVATNNESVATNDEPVATNDESVATNDESSDKSEIISNEESLNDNVSEVSQNEENDNSGSNSSGQTFQTTYYSAYDGTQIGVTATGVSMANGNIHNGNGERIVAVDPNVIPLGTTLKVVTDKGESFIASAEDSGGLIKGNRLDIAVSNPEEAMTLGRGTATVEIIG